MLDRRQFLGVIPASALVITSGTFAEAATQPQTDSKVENHPLICSPPVVQNPRENGFGVSIALNQLATCWVEYGFAENDLQYVARASHHGLIQADDRALHVRVQHPQKWPVGKPVYYRVVAQPLSYESAYRLHRGEPQETPVYQLQLPDAGAEKIRIASINDTHENKETLQLLHQQIAELQPDVLIWNGDTCNDFNPNKSTEQILLNPAQDVTQGWASQRPLLFSNGNHDVRGQKAREVPKSLAGCPESADLPYCQALRLGPLALITLDTGEDKPDQHPVFAGTAAYEPYRQQQANWLKNVVARPEIQSAPFKIAACHIPLRGLDGQPDGTSLDDYARFSGFGAKLWLPTLIEAGFKAILSGHTHRHRVDQPTAEVPLYQFVGGGPAPDSATVTVIDAEGQGLDAQMTIRVFNLKWNVLYEYLWRARDR